jgi:hypothetical protein
MNRTRWVLVLACLALATPALAQIGQGRLTGVVSDAQGAVLPGVTVTATSPALIGTQSSVTEADGRFRFPALPSGTYKLRFELSGFQALERDNIQIVLGQTITVDTQLKLATLAETVTVTGESPIVDVTTTKVGTSLKGDELIAVPNSTDVWGALSEAPGIRMQGFDVGGSHKSQQSAYEVFGIQNQARTVSDGVDHTEGVGGTGFYEDYYANEEVSVSALGSDVEMNSPGAAIVTTIKSGGNEFKGLYHLSYEPGEWVGDNNNSELEARGFTGNPNLLFWEGHADLGGPVKRDKVWFYGAYNHFKIDKAVSGVSEDIATDLGIFDNYTAKGTWKASGQDTVIGYFQQGRKQKPKRGLSALLPPESVRAQDSMSRMYKGEWQRVLTNRAFLDVNVGNFTLDWPMAVQVDPATNPPVVFRSTTAVAGAGWNAFSTLRKKPQVKAQFTYYLPEKAGSHDFKFGFESLYDSYRYGHNGTSGPIRYSYATPTSPVPDRIRFADVGPSAGFGTDWTTSPNVDLHYSGYLQDRWAPSNRLTFSLGVRIDYQKLSYKDAIRKPIIHDTLADGTQVFPEQSTVEGQTLVTNTNIAPRIGVTYDLTGKGRTVLKGFYGRYYNNLADGFSSANPGGTNYAEYNFFDLNANQRYDGPQELGTLRLRLGGASATVNPDLKTPYTEEYSGSLEHQFWGESSARFTYVRKSSRDFVPFYYTPLVPAWFGQLTVPVTAVGGNNEVFQLVDIPAELAPLSAQAFDNIPDSDFHYDTIEVAFQKRFGTKFFVQTSYDYQWRDELRSADIPSWGSTSPLVADPIGVGFFNNPNPSVSNRQKITNWHYQLLGRYTFPYEIGFAANLRYQSGFPYSRIIPDGTTDPVLNVTPSPFFVEDLKNNRSDNVALLNFRFDKGFTFGGRYKVTGMFDLYNVLNANPVTNFNLSSDDFGRIIAVLDPRVAQVGVRLEF